MMINQPLLKNSKVCRLVYMRKNILLYALKLFFNRNIQILQI